MKSRRSTTNSQDRTLSFAPTDFTVNKMGLSSTLTFHRLVVCSIVVLLLIQQTSSAPVDDALARCSPGSHRRNVCEKCAKVTKNEDAYLLCCTEEGDQQWCEDFLNFTLRP